MVIACKSYGFALLDFSFVALLATVHCTKKLSKGGAKRHTELSAVDSEFNNSMYVATSAHWDGQSHNDSHIHRDRRSCTRPDSSSPAPELAEVAYSSSLAPDVVTALIENENANVQFAQLPTESTGKALAQVQSASALSNRTMIWSSGIAMMLGFFSLLLICGCFVYCWKVRYYDTIPDPDEEERKEKKKAEKEAQNSMMLMQNQMMGQQGCIPGQGSQNLMQYGQGSQNLMQYGQGSQNLMQYQQPLMQQPMMQQQQPQQW